MKNYIVMQNSGDWDTYSNRPLFVTDSEKVAKTYCNKGNRIFKKYRPYFVKLRETLLRDYKREHPLKEMYCEVSDRADFVIGNFSYDEIEYRGVKP